MASVMFPSHPVTNQVSSGEISDIFRYFSFISGLEYLFCGISEPSFFHSYVFLHDRVISIEQIVGVLMTTENPYGILKGLACTFSPFCRIIHCRACLEYHPFIIHFSVAPFDISFLFPPNIPIF